MRFKPAYLGTEAMVKGTCGDMWQGDDAETGEWQMNWLRALLPRYWSQNNLYCRQWDEKLNELLDEYHFTNITKHTARIGGFEVWIENHPYGSFRPNDRLPAMRPKRRTIIRAWDQLMRDAFADIGKAEAGKQIEREVTYGR